MEIELRDHLETSSDKNPEFLTHQFLAILNNYALLNKNPFEVTMSTWIRKQQTALKNKFPKSKTIPNWGKDQVQLNQYFKTRK